MLIFIFILSLSVKVFDADYAKPDILSEALNQARVENIGINVPKVIEVKTIDVSS